MAEAINDSHQPDEDAGFSDGFSGSGIDKLSPLFNALTQLDRVRDQNLRNLLAAASGTPHIDGSHDDTYSHQAAIYSELGAFRSVCLTIVNTSANVEDKQRAIWDVFYSSGNARADRINDALSAYSERRVARWDKEPDQLMVEYIADSSTSYQDLIDEFAFHYEEDMRKDYELWTEHTAKMSIVEVGVLGARVIAHIFKREDDRSGN